MKSFPFVAAVAALWLGASCGPAALDAAPLERRALNIPGMWVPANSTLAAGDQQSVVYDAAPRVTAGGHCASTNPWACSCTHPACSLGLPGALEFGAFLRMKFPQISSLGGLGDCCRQSTGDTSYLSVHSLGRAIDLMIPTLNADADNTKGDPIAAWLIENAEDIGVQYVVWDRARWSMSRPPGQRYGPYTGSLSHTNHLHVELNLLGAARKTPFFLRRAADAGTCAAHCDGSRIVRSDCSTQNCAALGAACVSGPPPQCGTPACPPTGSARFCADATHLLTCTDGVGKTGDCAAFGSVCSIAGVAPDAARCVVSVCAGPEEIPTDHLTCAGVAPSVFHCTPDGKGAHSPCSPGEVCSVLDGGAHCGAPISQCPVPKGDAGIADILACLGTRAVVRCLNGNVIDEQPCGTNGTCTSALGSPHCARNECLAADGGVHSRPVCTASGDRALCDARGSFAIVAACGLEEACADDAGIVSCVVGTRPSIDDSSDDDLPLTPMPGDAGTGLVPVAAGCGCTPAVSWSPLLVGALASVAQRRRRR